VPFLVVSDDDLRVTLSIRERQSQTVIYEAVLRATADPADTLLDGSLQLSNCGNAGTGAG
jgi:hypothetical protein